MAKQNHTGRILPFSTAPRYNAEREHSQNYIGSQLAQARKDRGLTLVEFSALLKDYGVSVSSVAIHKWEKGQTTPNAYQLLAASQALDVGDGLSYFISSSAQSLNAEGRRKVSEYRQDLIASGRYAPTPPEPEPISYIEMPVSRLPVSAGVGTLLSEEHFETISFPEHAVPEGAEFGLRISGDSMEPVYHDGQIVWIKECSRLRVGEVGVFIYDGEGYLKVYDEQEPTESWADICSELSWKQPVMRSYNPQYPPKPVSPCAEFRIVGRVL